MLIPYKKQPKPPFTNRPLSWSQLSKFQYRPNEWYDHYILGKEQQSSPELLFGSEIDKKIQSDPSFLPEIPRYKHLQYELKTEYEGIPLIGYPDALDLDEPKIRDYKTGREKWDKARADKTGQLSMYLLMIWQIHKIKPEDFQCFIDWMPTCIKDRQVSFIEPFKVKTIETKRTMSQIVAFAALLSETRKKMIEYYNRHD